MGGVQLNLDGLQKVSDKSGEILYFKENKGNFSSSIQTIGGKTGYDNYPILYYYVDQESSNNDLRTVCKKLQRFVNDANNYSNNNYSSVCGYYKYIEVCCIYNYIYEYRVNSGYSRFYNKIVLKNISSEEILVLDERTVSSTEKIQYPLCILGMQPYFGQRA